MRVARAGDGRDFGQAAWVWRGANEKVTSGIAALDYSPDGTRLAVAAGDAVRVFCGVLDKNLGELLATVPAPGLRYDVQFSPDGTRLCYGATMRRAPGRRGDADDADDDEPPAKPDASKWPVLFVDAPPAPSDEPVAPAAPESTVASSSRRASRASRELDGR